MDKPLQERLLEKLEKVLESGILSQGIDNSDFSLLYSNSMNSIFKILEKLRSALSFDSQSLSELETKVDALLSFELSILESNPEFMQHFLEEFIVLCHNCYVKITAKPRGNLI